MHLPEGVNFYPSQTSMILAEKYGMDTSALDYAMTDHAFDSAELSDRQEIEAYWNRVRKTYVKNESMTLHDAVKFVNENYYRPVFSEKTSKALNEATIPSLHNLIKDGYGPELNTRQLVGRIKSEIINQLEPATDDIDPKTICIWGAPGIGKTAILKEANKLVRKQGYNLDIITMKCGALGRDDFELPDTIRNAVGQKLAISTPKSWLPVYDVAGLSKEQIKRIDEFYNVGAFRIYQRAGLNAKKMEIDNDDIDNSAAENAETIDEIIATSKYNGGIIFFDEFARMHPEVGTIMMNLMGERTYGNMILASRWLCLAASNRLQDDLKSEDDQAFREQWDVAKVSRYKHYTFVPTKEEWLVWARKKGADGMQNVDEMICDFIEHSPESVWYDALDLGSRPVPKNIGAALQDTTAQWETIGEFLTSSKDNESMMKLNTWNGRTWHQIINSTIKLALKNELFRNDNAAYLACFSDTTRKDERTGEEYSVKNIDLTNLEEQLNKVDNEIWFDWVSDKYQTFDPGEVLARNNRLKFFLQWISEVVIAEAVGEGNAPHKKWKEYTSFRSWLTPAVIKSIWNTGKFPGKDWQEDDNIIYANAGDYQNTRKSGWKSNTLSAKEVINEILKQYPGNIQDELSKDIKKLQSTFNVPIVKQDIQDMCDYYDVVFRQPDQGKTFEKNLLFWNPNDFAEMSQEDRESHARIFKYSKVARQLSNVAMFITKICIQTGQSTFAQEAEAPITQLGIMMKAEDTKIFQTSKEAEKIVAISTLANRILLVGREFDLDVD